MLLSVLEDNQMTNKYFNSAVRRTKELLNLADLVAQHCDEIKHINGEA
jgi:hypothetical protein